MKSLDQIVALAKRRGFVYQTAELYGGLNGVYDFGHLGVLLKQNIRAAWRQSIMATNSNILFLEGAILGPHAMWEASGHTQNFSDPLIDCTNCKRRFRADDIDTQKACLVCGKKAWTDIRQFQLMFETNLGAVADQSTTAYLRPETAQSIFVNFKNIMSTNRVKLPFGIAQIGKAFRNEITPKQFLFRMREFEQMELEWFCTSDQADEFFDLWVASRENFYTQIGINMDHIKLSQHEKSELSHYSSRTTDIEYEFPFGYKELEGIADRGTFDLTQHSKHSGKDLSVHDEATKQSYTPHVIECSVGVDRLFLTLLCDAYTQDTIGGEERTVLKLSPRMAPIKAAVLPLTKKLSEPARALYNELTKLGVMIEFDESGSIGKRYRRQDEIGTPICFTYDFDSKQDNSITVRDRDTTKQERISIDTAREYVMKILQR
ncbi:glycine--tRNA ligase [Candidatus Dependentiae bacterium]|nr:MAG: glycine--tRNA ligase [Candidatus Dependentiae bacterium]